MELDDSQYSQTVTRGFAVLDAIHQAGSPLGVHDIARRTRLSPSQVHRLLVSLKMSGAVQQIPESRSYWLGWRLVDYAQMLLGDQHVRSHALPILLRLRDLTAETTTLFLPMGSERVCVEEVESPQDIRRKGVIGRRFPLYAGAAGRAILAFLDPSAVEYVLSPPNLGQLTPNTITDRRHLEAMLEEVYTTGIARSCEETTPGVSSVATPFFRGDGIVAGSIGIAGPTCRFTPELTASFEKNLLASGLELSKRLGCSKYPWGGSMEPAPINHSAAT